jgi:predicted Rossmann fold nucleotide-binding protein DprA/Smf involved in DNA uptake
MAARLTIVSGGQTGVDRAALDVALELGIPCGGWCPRGRLAEDGPIPARYPLRESASPDYAERTRLNVRDSDATLVLTRGAPTGGTALTLRLADELGRPALVLDLATAPRPEAAARWIAGRGIAVLNVAGPRESGAPGIYAEAAAFLRAALAEFAPTRRS